MASDSSPDEAPSPYMRFTLRNPSERAEAVVPNRLYKQPEFASTSVKYKRIPEPQGLADNEVDDYSSFPPAYPRPFSMPSRASLLDCLTDDESILSTIVDLSSFRRSPGPAWEAPIDVDDFQRFSENENTASPCQIAGISPMIRTPPVSRRRPAPVRVKESGFVCDFERHGEQFLSSCSSGSPADHGNALDDDYFDDDDEDEDESEDFSKFSSTPRNGQVTLGPVVSRRSISTRTADREVGMDEGCEGRSKKKFARKRSFFRMIDVHMPASSTKPSMYTGDQSSDCEQVSRSEDAKLARHNSSIFRRPLASRRSVDEARSQRSVRKKQQVYEEKGTSETGPKLVRHNSLFGWTQQANRRSVERPRRRAQDSHREQADGKLLARVRQVWARTRT